MNDGIYIAVIGPSAATDAACEQARDIGALLAQRGAIVVVGSMDGVSGAAAQAARAGGGNVVFLSPETGRGGHAGTILVPTGLGELCNGLVVRTADAIVSVGGGWGTLMEIALAQRTGVPVVSLDGWRLSDAAGGSLDGPTRVATTAAAVEQAWLAATARVRSGAPRLV